MPKLNKKLIPVFFVVFVLVPVLFGILSSQKAPKESESPTSGAQISPVPIKSDYLTPNNVKYNFRVQGFETPERLQVLEVDKQNTMTEDQVVDLGVKTGLGNYYRKYLNAENQRLYLFRNSKENMTIRADQNQLSYRTSFTGGEIRDSKLSDAEIQEIALSFLVDKFGLNRENYFLSFVGYFKEGDEHPTLVRRDQANVFKVNFSPINLGYKMVSSNPQESPISVWVKIDGTIAKAEIAFFNNPRLTEELYDIVTFDELKKNTDKILIMQTIVDKVIGIKYPEKDLKQIDITKVELAYFYSSPTDTKFLPIYLMEGQGIAPQVDYPVELIMYSPAVK